MAVQTGARLSAAWIGHATTTAVVVSYVLILCVDYVMTYLQFRFS